jgi:hypothetical protein
MPHWQQLPIYQQLVQIFQYWSQLSPIIDQANPIPHHNQSFESWMRTCLRRNLPSVPHLQRHLSSGICQQRIRHFRNNIRTQPIDFQRLWRSSNSSIAGSFLQAWPKPQWYLTNNEFQVTVRLRLGIPCLIDILPTLEWRCICRNHPIITYDSTHLLLCLKTNHQTRRHNAIVDVFLSMAQDAGISYSKQSEHITFISDDIPRKVDFVFFNPTLPGHPSHRSIAFDPTIINPFSTHYSIRQFLQDSSSIYAHARKDKVKKYRDVCSISGFDFIPLVINCYGNVTEEVSTLIHRLASAASDRSNIPFSTLFFHFKTNFIITLYRANAFAYTDFIRRMSTPASQQSSSQPTIDATDLTPIDTLPDDGFDNFSTINMPYTVPPSADLDISLGL